MDDNMQTITDCKNCKVLENRIIAEKKRENVPEIYLDPNELVAKAWNKEINAFLLDRYGITLELKQDNSGDWYFMGLMDWRNQQNNES